MHICIYTYTWWNNFYVFSPDICWHFLSCSQMLIPVLVNVSYVLKKINNAVYLNNMWHKMRVKFHAIRTSLHIIIYINILSVSWVRYSQSLYRYDLGFSCESGVTYIEPLWLGAYILIMIIYCQQIYSCTFKNDSFPPVIVSRTALQDIYSYYSFILDCVPLVYFNN